MGKGELLEASKIKALRQLHLLSSESRYYRVDEDNRLVFSNTKDNVMLEIPKERLAGLVEIGEGCFPVNDKYANAPFKVKRLEVSETCKVINCSKLPHMLYGALNFDSACSLEVISGNLFYYFTNEMISDIEDGNISDYSIYFPEVTYNNFNIVSSVTGDYIRKTCRVLFPVEVAVVSDDVTDTVCPVRGCAFKTYFYSKQSYESLPIYEKVSDMDFLRQQIEYIQSCCFLGSYYFPLFKVEAGLYFGYSSEGDTFLPKHLSALTQLDLRNSVQGVGTCLTEMSDGKLEIVLNDGGKLYRLSNLPSPEMFDYVREVLL